jgi:GNAT superfamily N-acetyltransferase
MKFKELFYLKEAPVFDEKNLELGNKKNDKTNWELMSKKYEDMKKSSMIQITKLEDMILKTVKAEDNFTLYVGNGKDLFAIYIYYFEDIGSREVPFINFSVVRPEYRGKGITTKIMNYMLNKFNSVGSDYDLTGKDGKGSFQPFEKFSTQYRSAIYSDSGKLTVVDKITDKHMNDSTTRFIIFNVKR